MKNVFIGKNNLPYAITDLELGKVLQNNFILENYSMSELDTLYKRYFGDYTDAYPYILAAKIKVYDSSPAINSFIVDGQTYWLDKATRVGLMHLANCSTEDVQLVLEDRILTFAPDVLKEMLAKLEVYAGACYLQTQKHLMAVKQLKTTEEIINYDYTTGYPDKLILS